MDLVQLSTIQKVDSTQHTTVLYVLPTPTLANKTKLGMVILWT